MRAVVCGGRDFTDRQRLFAELDRLRAERGITHICTGAQRRFNRETKRWEGADYYAEEWARERRLWYSGLAANFKKFGPPGGPKRNQAMLDQFKPEIVIATPRANGEWGPGTTDMTHRARSSGVEVVEIR